MRVVLPAGERARAHYEGRLEFWDGATETAWKVCEPTSIQHEQPSSQLAQMVTGSFAMLRGSRDRVLRFGGPGAPGRFRAQALADAGRPGAVPAPGPGAACGAGHRRGRPTRCPTWCWRWTTRRTCAGASSGSTRGAGFRRSGCWCRGIRRCVSRDSRSMCAAGSGYREEGESRAFPGWKAQEIHRALTEAPMSEPAWRALRTHGAGDGSARRHDSRSTIRSAARSASRRSARGRREMLTAVLKARGIASEAADPAEYSRVPRRVFEARRSWIVALVCTDEADFRRRVRGHRTWHGGRDASLDREAT